MVKVFHKIFQNRRKKCQRKLKTVTSLARNLPKNCAKLIDSIKNTICDVKFIQQHRQNNSDFTRKRCLPFSTVIIFLINLLRSSIQNELDKFFQALYNRVIPIQEVTASAFCQARQKLKYTAFIALIHKVKHEFYQTFTPNLWQGLRLLAVDGSTIQLPKLKEIEDYFGAWHPAKSTESCPMARVSHLFDVLNHVTLDASIAPKTKGERVLAAEHFQHLEKNDLVLLDRGYPAFWLFQLILYYGAHFCARLPIDLWTKTIQEFVASNLSEQIISLEPTFNSRKECQILGLLTESMQVRLIRIELDNGELEVLVTSLIDCKTYPHELFKDLYFKRWPIEEMYKLYKSRIEIGNFTGKSVQAIKQDFYARVFMCNLTSILAFPVHEKIDEKHQESKLDYKINWTQALAKMKNSVISLFFGDNVIDIINYLFKLFLANNSAIRPGRKFERKKSFATKKYAFAYKPIA